MLLRRFFNASVYIRRLWHGLDFSGVPILIHIAKGEARRRENLGGDKVAVSTGGTRRGTFNTAAGSAAMSWALRIKSSLVLVAAR